MGDVFAFVTRITEGFITTLAILGARNLTAPEHLQTSANVSLE